MRLFCSLTRALLEPMRERAKTPMWMTLFNNDWLNIYYELYTSVEFEPTIQTAATRASCITQPRRPFIRFINHNLFQAQTDNQQNRAIVAKLCSSRKLKIYLKIVSVESTRFLCVCRKSLIKSCSVTAHKFYMRVNTLIYLIGTAYFMEKSNWNEIFLLRNNQLIINS